MTQSEDTPMMRQYHSIRAEYPGAVLFYRLGDFYEMFYEDAVEVSQLLDLTLTSRNKNQENPVPMCGVPHHAADSYIARLIERGRRVVICDQVEDPKTAKGVVRREVTRVLSPGVLLEESSLSDRRGNFILSIVPQDQGYQVLAADVSTGELSYGFSHSDVTLHDEISRLSPREIICAVTQMNQKGMLGVKTHFEDILIHAVNDEYFSFSFAEALICEHYGISNLSALGLDENRTVISALGGLLGLLRESRVLKPQLLRYPSARRVDKTLYLDESSIRHLDLFKTNHDGKNQGSLLWHLDQCATAMGSRLLASFLRAPSYDVDEINERQDFVEELVRSAGAREALLEKLKGLADIERLANRFVIGSGSPRDAVALKDALMKLPHLKKILLQLQNSLAKKSVTLIQDFSSLRERIAATLVDEPPSLLQDGGYIRDQVHPELDELRGIEKNGKSTIAQLENRERQRTGISSLKVRYNSVFGYYIEITNVHRDKVPENYIRKQTLTNAERYITPELKEYEEKVLGATERIRQIEVRIFQDLRESIVAESAALKTTAQTIALLDVILSFSCVAVEFGYVRPRVTNRLVIDIKEGRHPVLERLAPEKRFVANSVYLESPSACQVLITGPNMSGKSTLMRMTALLVLQAQMGCFVPCESAEIGLCDRIFTRVGASDHLQKGLSTFMVEMVETARILREATPRSLIVLDEIGRGTSTFDGVSIAWAVAEDLHDRLAARTLFATHYHELCDLAEQKRGIRNAHMAVKEAGGQIVFLNKLQMGPTNRSYGVAVAGMAGLAPSVIKRAKEILELLEVKDLSFKKEVSHDVQGTLFDKSDKDETHSKLEVILRELSDVDVNAMTPLEALNYLSALKEKIV